MTTLKKITAILLTMILFLTVLTFSSAEESRIWQKGDSGDTVLWIQQRLYDLDYLSRKPDGSFDEDTETALMLFQRDYGLLVTGMADSVTMETLKNARERASSYGKYTEIEVEEFDSYALEYFPAMALGYAAVPYDTDWNTNEYSYFEGNRFLSARTSPLSTFAADVDTSSYAQFRRRVLNGEVIPPDSIRVEEMLNYFRYDYAQPRENEPFGVTVSMAPCPWNDQTRLLQIGLQAETLQADQRPGHNLVFLIDTSGSMEGSDRLDLVKRAFLMLLEELKDSDTISIVTYASQDRVVLEGVPAREKTRIMEAISDLEAKGSTNGAAGLIRAYEIAEKYRIQDGVNRILLATDGDLNVGLSSEGDLARLVSEKKQNGVSLTCLGFGMGNYKDNRMEALADYGNGNCWYIDTIYEARKALVTEADGTFITVAKDVKIQVDFNPALIRGYRLIGYEDRLMNAEDFADDTKDGGEIGSGHRVTVLYELVPADSEFDFGASDSRYAQTEGESKTDEMLTIAIRAKEPEGEVSHLYEYPVSETILSRSPDDNMKFAAAVAETSMLLRDSEWKGTSSWQQVQELLRSCESLSGDVYKEEFLYLVNLLERAQVSIP